MHRTAEYGIAAHWRYKEAGGTNGAAGRQGVEVDEMAWMRRSCSNWQREAADPGEFMEAAALRPGHPRDLRGSPRRVTSSPCRPGSEPVDFAYAVHTEVGHRCIGSRVAAARLVALERTLENGQVVEIFTSKAEATGPSRDWLSFVASPRAKTKIKQWFAKERREEAIEAGKEAITREARRTGTPLQQLVSPDGMADPGCFRSWLQDIQGTGIYSFSTNSIPTGSYEAKVALNGTWDVNYGQGGVQNGPNIAFTVPANDMEVAFQWNSTTKDLRIIVGGIRGDLTKAQAYWLSADTIAWNVPTDTVVRLFADPDGVLTLDGPGIVTGPNSHSWTLVHDPAGLPAALKARFPHLANLAAFKLPPEAIAAAAQSLKGQLAIGAARAGQGVDATGLQIPGVLDDLYSANAGPVTLGPSFKNGQATLRVWAPTARDMKLRVFADSSTATFTSLPMTLDPASGIWSYSGGSLYGKYYQYETQVFVRSTNKVETNIVTDPYSVSLARNSTRSHLVSLEDQDLQPRGWRTLAKPRLAAPEDIVLYELHVRDFSATDATVPAALRGTFAAFAQKRSDGMKHLATLGLAGVTHVHLLPSFDFATTNEDKSAWESPSFETLAALPPTPPSSRRWSRRRRTAMPTTGATTRCTTTCPRAATRPMPTAPRAFSSFARWCSRSARAGCAW